MLDESAYKSLRHFTNRLGKESWHMKVRGPEMGHTDWATDEERGEEGE